MDFTWAPMAWVLVKRKFVWDPMAVALFMCKFGWDPIGWGLFIRKFAWDHMASCLVIRKLVWDPTGCGYLYINLRGILWVGGYLLDFSVSSLGAQTVFHEISSRIFDISYNQQFHYIFLENCFF